MMKSMMRNFIVMSVGVMLSSLLIFSARAEDQGPREILNKDDPFVQMLEKRYDLYLDAIKKGDVGTYKTMRPKEIIAFMQDQLERNDMVRDFGREIQKTTDEQQDYKKFKFSGCNVKGKTARLSYQRYSDHNDVPSKPQVEFLIIMFHLEDDVWKVLYVKEVKVF